MSGGGAPAGGGPSRVPDSGAISPSRSPRIGTVRSSQLSGLAMSWTRQVQTLDTSLIRARDAVSPCLFLGLWPAGWALRRAGPMVSFAFLQDPSAGLGFGPAAERQGAPGRVAVAVEFGRRLRGRAPGGDEGRPAVRTVAEDAPVPASGSGGGAGTRCLGRTGSTAERAWCPGSAPRRGTRLFCPRAHPTPT